MGNNKLFKGLTMLMIIIFTIAGVVWGIGKYIDNANIAEIVKIVEDAYGYRTTYSKGDSVIKVNFTTANKDSLYEITSLALPKLRDLPSGTIGTLVVNAKYLEGESQSYVVRFKDIGRIDWDKVTNLDILINVLSEFM